ncbi:MAG: hypothetical protein GY820_30705 [Gammaproteobacteria bacterium]|nr:hypothetical protein [Gammaproteobacteria bacterium]
MSAITSRCRRFLNFDPITTAPPVDVDVLVSPPKEVINSPQEDFQLDPLEDFFDEEYILQQKGAHKRKKRIGRSSKPAAKKKKSTKCKKSGYDDSGNVPQNPPIVDHSIISFVAGITGR